MEKFQTLQMIISEDLINELIAKYSEEEIEILDANLNLVDELVDSGKIRVTERDSLWLDSFFPLDDVEDVEEYLLTYSDITNKRIMIERIKRIIIEPIKLNDDENN